jgi:tetratricopeptide (TPR) repeat protein
MPNSPAPEPPALAALRNYPLLLASVEPGMQQQAAAIDSARRTFVERQSVLATLDEHLRTIHEGLIALEGPPGSGVTTLLQHLAATRPYAFWLSDHDARQGASALAAQLIALHRASIPLIPPAIQNAPTTLERFLEETATQLPPGESLVLLMDPPASELQPHTPIPLVLPGTIPPNVIIIYGNVSGARLPFAPAARVVLPDSGPDVHDVQTRLLQQMQCPEAWVEPIIAAARGNMLYVRLAYGLLRHTMLTPESLKPGISTLHRVWWEHLSMPERRLALLLAAADEALPVEMCSAYLHDDARPTLAQWQAIGIATPPGTTVSLAHWSTRAYLARQHKAHLEHAHAELARRAVAVFRLSEQPDTPLPASPPDTPPEVTTYLARQFARHAALGTYETQTQVLPLVAQRAWVRMQERRTDSLADAAYDLAWELHVAATLGPLVRLARGAALASTLVSLARSMSPDAAVEALNSAIARHGRESGLRQISALVEQLPDVQARALVLRQLGDACYSANMRTQAMRFLSQALDIEEQKTPAAWREQREHLHTALASAALERGQVDMALRIAARISHTERRGMLETRVVHWLLEQGIVPRARQLADHIEHESLGAWAQAEVAVTLARMGDPAAAETLLARIPSETATAWAQIELACDDAARDEDAARQRIERLDSPNQRDRGRAQLARALAAADKDGDALDAAAQIGDVAVRVSALLELRLMLEGLVAMLALDKATSVIGKLPRDVRVPLVSMLAASYAAMGHIGEAMGVAGQLAAGEEYDRALSRIAAALGQCGDFTHALEIARSLGDEDERDWTLDELARMLAEEGQWDEAQALTSEISPSQQARSLSDLAIARARAGDPLNALELANRITSVQPEYARAVLFIAPPLVAAGYSNIALAIVEEQYVESISIPPHVLTPPQASRYLMTVAMALAEHGQVEEARNLTQRIPRPLDRARAHIATAYAATQQQQLALEELGLGLRAALLGRNEAFRLLEEAVPVFVALEGAPVLEDIAAAVDEMDAW